MTDRELHETITRVAQAVRQRLSDANVGSNFQMVIEASGRLNSSEPLKISYKVSEGLWGGGPQGNALTPTTDECLRRLGWQKAYSPELLAAPEEFLQPPPAPAS